MTKDLILQRRKMNDQKQLCPDQLNFGPALCRLGSHEEIARIKRLLDECDPDRDYLADRPEKELQRAFDKKNFFFISCEETEEGVGSLALYRALNALEWELGTCLVLKKCRKLGVDQFSVFEICATIILVQHCIANYRNLDDINIFALVKNENENPDRTLLELGFKHQTGDKDNKKLYVFDVSKASELAKKLLKTDCPDNILMNCRKGSDEASTLKFLLPALTKDAIQIVADKAPFE